MKSLKRLPKTCFGDSMQKCRTALNPGSIELFNDGSKIGEPQLPGVWSLAATTTPTKRQYPAGSMLTGSLKEEIISYWGLAPNPPGFFALLPAQNVRFDSKQKGAKTSPPLVWPLGLRSSCVPALLCPQPRSATV